jgi:hypothetical protein
MDFESWNYNLVHPCRVRAIACNKIYFLDLSIGDGLTFIAF